MQPNKSNRQRIFLCPGLLDQLDPRNRLLGLAKVIPWQVFEDSFRTLYAASGHLGKPVRLMVGLLILKQLENLNDGRVVEAWVQNQYFQAFCGHLWFTWKLACDPSELTYFRRRIGESRVRKILEGSVALHGEKAKEAEVVVNSIVQEKKITFHTDAKFLIKVVTRCHTMAKLEEVKLLRSYQREIKSLLRAIRFKSKGSRQGESQRSARRLRPIAAILVRELKRKLSPEALTIRQQTLDIYDRVQRQQRYSLREPGVSCISKGKARMKYEISAKASVAVTKTNGIIVGALSFQDNPFDGHTLPAVLSQVESIVGQGPAMGICDRGCRGKRKVGVTSIEIPESGGRAKTASSKRQAKERFCRRAAIAPIIGHLKNDHGMLRNYLKGQIGDAVNLFMAALRSISRSSSEFCVFLCLKFLGRLLRPNVHPVQACA